MLSSNSSSCNQNPNYTLFSENDINSFATSKSDPNNFTFFPFPNSPNFEYEDVYLQLLDQVDLDAAADWNGGKIINNAVPSAADGIGGRNPSSGTAASAAAAAAGGRRMKKDRHSKINTARGPRDRRMRLSLDIARKFFDLQDLLRFDKASRTVDWLLRNSAAAIRELVRSRDGVLDCSSLILTESNCTSEDCGEAATSSSATEVKTTAATASRRGKRGGVIKQKRARVGKESRNKARDRARERTSQKRRLMRENNDGTVDDAHGTTTTAAAAAACITTSNNFPLIYDAAFGRDEAKITAAPLCQFSFHQTTNQFFYQSEQIAEINQFNDKTWEVYNSFNLSE